MSEKDISAPSLFKKKVLKLATNFNFVLGIWLLLAILSTCKQYAHGQYNNYLIFKSVYHHALEGLNLYLAYPNDHLDTNHYGPLFAMIIAPFAILPNFIGMLLWQFANTLFLFFAIKSLPIKHAKLAAIYWIVAHELLTAMFSFQFNSSIAAMIIYTYVLIDRKQNFWAAFMIILGTFVKLYGIVGMAFFFFAKEKPKLIAYGIFWALVCLVLPMAFFGPSYILQSYHDWYVSIVEKGQLNASLTSMQDISVMGIVRRVTGNIHVPDLPFILSGLLLFCIPYLRIQQYKAQKFRLLFLASTLLFTVIFSNSSESPTYIIAFVGVAIWFVLQQQPQKPWVIALFVFAFLLTSLSPSDLFPASLRESLIKPYSLKALPCIIIWLVTTYQLIFEKFNLKSTVSVE